MRSGSQQLKQAFTLVELLVVIGIIAVLVGILLPALSKAKQQANIVVCSSNLRQLSVCMMMYETDYKGGLIPHWTVAPMWQYMIKPYISKIPANQAPGQVDTRDMILRCPAANEKPTDDSDKSPTASPFQAFYTDNGANSSTNAGGFKIESAYGMLRYLYGVQDPTNVAQYGTNKGFWNSTPNFPNANFWMLQRISAKRPQPIPMLFDCRWREAYVDNGSAVRLLEPGRKRLRADELHRDQASRPRGERGVHGHERANGPAAAALVVHLAERFHAAEPVAEGPVVTTRSVLVMPRRSHL